MCKQVLLFSMWTPNHSVNSSDSLVYSNLIALFTLWNTVNFGLSLVPFKQVQALFLSYPSWQEFNTNRLILMPAWKTIRKAFLLSKITYCILKPNLLCLWIFYCFVSSALLLLFLSCSARHTEAYYYPHSPTDWLCDLGWIT